MKVSGKDIIEQIHITVLRYTQLFIHTIYMQYLFVSISLVNQQLFTKSQKKGTGSHCLLGTGFQSAIIRTQYSRSFFFSFSYNYYP